MLENLFGNIVIEKILFYMLTNKKTYASQLSKTFNMPLFSFQKAMNRLERGGIIVSQMEGRTRIYIFNPRYALLKELKVFLEKAYSSLPENFRLKYYEPPIRKRPRRKGKPL